MKKQSQATNILFQFAILLVFMVILFLIFAPAIQGHYVSGEDYGNIWTSKWPLLSKQSYFSYILDFPYEGRSLKDLYLYTIYNKYINVSKSLEAANTVRAINIFVLGLLAYVLYLIFKANKLNNVSSFLLSILLCTLPPFQIYIARLCCGAFTYSVLLTSLSALILFTFILNIQENTKNKVYIATVVSIAIILQLIAYTFYQAGVMTYWAIALIPLMRLKDENILQKWRFPFAIYFFTGFMAMAIYFVMLKASIYLIDFNDITFTKRGGIIGLDMIYPKIVGFIKYPLFTALNLWNIFPSKNIGLIVSAVIIAVFLFGLGRAIRNKERLPSISIYVLALILVPMSYLSNMVIRESFAYMIPVFRTLVGLEMAVLLLFYWGLMNISDFFKSLLSLSENLKKNIMAVILVILTVMAAFSAHTNINNFKNLHSGELSYVKNAMQEYGVSKLSKDSPIHMIHADKHKLNYFSEFFYLTSFWEKSSTWLVYLALYELGGNADISIIFIEESAASLPKNSFIINMKSFQERAYKEMGLPASLRPLF